MLKVSNELAKKEVVSWLTFQGYTPEEIDEKEDQVKELVSLIENGSLVLNPESFEFSYKLRQPLKGDVTTSELVFLPRLTAGQTEQALHNSDAKNIQSILIGYCAALTGKPRNVIKALSNIDYKAIQKIAVFFI